VAVDAEFDSPLSAPRGRTPRESILARRRGLVQASPAAENGASEPDADAEPEAETEAREPAEPEAAVAAEPLVMSKAARRTSRRASRRKTAAARKEANAGSALASGI
jgi:hypothetical protein